MSEQTDRTDQPDEDQGTEEGTPATEEQPEPLPVPETADEFLRLAEKADDEAVETYQIPEWRIAVKLRATCLRDYYKVRHNLDVQQKGGDAWRADVVSAQAWISACVVAPVFSDDQVRKLTNRSSKPMLDLVEKCRKVSGDLFDKFDALTAMLGEDFGQAALMNASTPPASGISGQSPPEQD